MDGQYIIGNLHQIVGLISPRICSLCSDREPELFMKFVLQLSRSFIAKVRSLFGLLILCIFNAVLT